MSDLEEEEQRSSKSYQILENDDVGRYLVSERSLKAGETVLEDWPVVVGPKSGSPALCLGCLQPVDASVLCTKCRWPVCGEACEALPSHEAECAVFSRARAVFQGVADPLVPLAQYECVTPLRALLFMEARPEEWSAQVAPLQSHCELRAQGSHWHSEHVNVVKYLRLACKLSKRFTEESIHKVCGILEVNSYEVMTPGGTAVRGLYPLAALLSHCCVANTTHTIIPQLEYKMVLRATIEVDEGKELFCSYTSSLQPTLMRREGLRYSKYFECKCPRCADPTELGTHMSTLKCANCHGGYILSTDPLDEESRWKCNQCDFGVSADGVKRMFEEIKTEVEEVDELAFAPEKVERAEEVLEKYKDLLHIDNALNSSLWHNLILLYGKAEGFTLDELPDELYQQKIELCKQLLKLLDVVEPGYTRIRGVVLYEYHTVLEVWAKMKYHYGEVTEAQYKQLMSEVQAALAQSLAILSLEPEGSPYATLAKQAAIALTRLDTTIASLLF